MIDAKLSDEFFDLVSEEDYLKIESTSTFNESDVVQEVEALGF